MKQKMNRLAALAASHAARARVAGGAALLGLGTAAHAELPAAVNTAITAAGDDLKTAAGAIIAAMAAVWGLRKLGQKMGWW